MAYVVPAVLANSIYEYLRIAKLFEDVCRQVHFDFADGSCTSKITPSVDEILSITKNFNFIKNFHLMTINPIELIDKLYPMNEVGFVYAPIEKLHIKAIEQYKKKIVPVIQVNQDPRDFLDLITTAQNIQIMTVEIGDQGNDFIPASLEKINFIKDKNPNSSIHIDGHVNPETIATIMRYKPDILNVGSYLSRSTKPREDWLKLQSLANNPIARIQSPRV